jgi:hypothetical protein
MRDMREEQDQQEQEPRSHSRFPDTAEENVRGRARALRRRRAKNKMRRATRNKAR